MVSCARRELLRAETTQAVLRSDSLESLCELLVDIRRKAKQVVVLRNIHGPNFARPVIDDVLKNVAVNLAKAFGGDRRVVRQCLDPVGGSHPLESPQLSGVSDVFFVPENIGPRIEVGIGHQVEAGAFLRRFARTN
jgi:hypothetical protein